MCLGVKHHLASGHEISRLQHGLQLIMARYTRIINCRPCCNLYIISKLSKITFLQKYTQNFYCMHYCFHTNDTRYLRQTLTVAATIEKQWENEQVVKAISHHRHTRTVQTYSPGCANVHPHLTRFLWPNRVHIPNVISIGSAVFAWLMAESLYFAMGHPFLLKIALHTGRSGPHLIHGFLGPPKSHPKWHLDRFSRFCRAHDCDRPTDHTTPSAATGHIYVALRCSLKWLGIQTAKVIWDS